jgi:APA family basic amino acid/polyamine antiporter
LGELIKNETIGLKRCLGIFSCTMLVVGNMIGVGIFVTPGSIAARLPSSGLIFLAWIVGAFLAICGALAYAELGAAYPFAGGNYVFLREAYSPLWGFLYGWTAAFITQAGTVAVLAIGFTKYAGISSTALSLASGIGLIVFFGLLNYIGVQVGAAALDLITFLKILSIGVLVGAGAAWGHGSFSHLHPLLPSNPGGWIALALATALIPIMYTYSGWNATVYVGSEVERPSRTIPLSLLLGVLLTAALYLGLNALYLYALPVSGMRGVIAIAAASAQLLFNPTAARVISAMIAVSVLGCINATLLTAPRILYAMGQDGTFFRSAGRVHPRFQTPSLAIILETVWSIVLVLWGCVDRHGFDRLLDYVTVPSLLLNALTVAALFVLRKKKPDLPRPYRAWGYPVLPACFVLMILWIVASELHSDPRGALIGAAIVAAGAPFFQYFRRSIRVVSG